MERLLGKHLLTSCFLPGHHATSFPSLLSGEHFNQKKRYVRAPSYANAIGLVGFANMFPHRISFKWHTHSDFALKTGDLVLKIEPESLRGCSPLARIAKLNYGQDGCSRSALATTATREVTRSTVKLASALPSSRGRMLQSKYKTEYRCLK